MPDRSVLRQQLRTRRQSLTTRERGLRANDLFKRLSRQRLYMNSRRVAVYLPADGEIDTYAIIRHAWSMGKEIYLPVLVPHQRNSLWFARHTPESTLVSNRFGIPEPETVHRQRVAANALDLVLTPLVGFDTKGNRLGMGGGFYDRSFAFLRRRHSWFRPRLVGLAYDFQKIRQLPAQAWDVPLAAVITDRQWYGFL